MLSKIIALLCCLSISNLGLACSKPVTYMSIGDTAQCNGYLFSEEKEKEVRTLKIDHYYLQKEVEKKDQMLQLYKEQNKLLEEVAEKERQRTELWKTTSKDLAEVKPMTDTQKVLYFVGGILTTVAAGYAIGQASK